MKVLWISPNLPRPERDGGDRRRWQMMTTLSQQGAAISLWSETGHDAGRYGPALEAANISWAAPPPARRQEASSNSRRLAVREMVARDRWDIIVFSYSYLAARHIESVRQHTPGTPLLVDLGNTRFHQVPGSEETTEIANSGELEVYAQADGLITASETDTRWLLEHLPHVPGYTFAPLAPAPPASPQSALDGPLVFWGNMSHHASANAVGWWMDEIAGETARHYGAPLPLQLRGAGIEIYRSVWQASGRLEVGPATATIDGARVVILPLRHGSETAATALTAATRGIPVVATSAALSGLDPALAAQMGVGESAEELGQLVAHLMSDDEAWQHQRDQLFSLAGTEGKRRRALEQEFGDWMARRHPITGQSTGAQSDAS